MISQQSGWVFSREQCGAGLLGEQASGRRTVGEQTMDAFFHTQDFRRHPSPGNASPGSVVEPIPTPEPLVERAGDVEIGGFHLIEMHWATVFSGGGLVLLIIGVICVTYCCIKGHLQLCCINSCRLCCPSDLGGDPEQGRQEQGVRNPAGGSVGASGAQLMTTVQATAPTAMDTVAIPMGTAATPVEYSRTLEDILAARRLRKGGCGGCYGGHTQGACMTGQSIM